MKLHSYSIMKDMMEKYNLEIAIKYVPLSGNNTYKTTVHKDEGPVLIVPEDYTGKILPDG